MGRIEINCDCNAINESVCIDAQIALNSVFGQNNDIDRLTEFYKTFADSTRLKIIYILDKMEKLCVCDIAYSLNTTKSVISHQLKYLRDNNLVKQEKAGKTIYYSLIDEHVKDIFEIGLTHIKEKNAL